MPAPPGGRNGDDRHTLELFSRFLARNLGLFFRGERLGELRQKCEGLCRELGKDDPKALMLSLMAKPWGRETVELLAGALTIGETYFLRDPASYRVLELELLPELIATRRAREKRLRIWSAGCSTGEEPYSIAILLSRIIADLEEWDLTLLATDINPQALEKARRGVYSQWSFRDAPPWLSGYFLTRPSGELEVRPEIRKMVQFAHLNLAEPCYPSPVNGTWELDIIFCRNVLLYFEPEVIGQVLDRLHASLGAGGALFVSPTEIDQRYLGGFDCCRYPGAFVFRKIDPVSTPPPPTGDALPCREGDGRVARRRSLKASPPPSPSGPVSVEIPLPGDRAGGPPAETAQKDAARFETKARALADRGDFEEARRFCEKALAADRLRISGHYLLFLILAELGDQEGAELALKRTLYLDHDFVVGWFSLGNLCRKLGRAKESRRHESTCLKLLEARDPDELLPESGGMTAGGLAEVIRRQRRG